MKILYKLLKKLRYSHYNSSYLLLKILLKQITICTYRNFCLLHVGKNHRIIRRVRKIHNFGETKFYSGTKPALLVQRMKFYYF